jgi:hypothetical protein
MAFEPGRQFVLAPHSALFGRDRCRVRLPHLPKGQFGIESHGNASLFVVVVPAPVNGWIRPEEVTQIGLGRYLLRVKRLYLDLGRAINEGPIRGP